MTERNNFDTIFKLNSVSNGIKKGQRFILTYRLNAERSILAPRRTTYQLVLIDVAVMPNQNFKIEHFRRCCVPSHQICVKLFIYVVVYAQFQQN